MLKEYYLLIGNFTYLLVKNVSGLVTHSFNFVIFSEEMCEIMDPYYIEEDC